MSGCPDMTAKEPTMTDDSKPPSQEPTRSERGQWLPGHKAPGPGRPKGVRNYLSNLVHKVTAEDVEKYGREYVKKVRTRYPATWWRGVTYLVRPTTADIHDDAKHDPINLDNMTAEDAIGIIMVLYE